MVLLWLVSDAAPQATTRWNPASTRHSPDAGLMLDHRLGRWTNNKTNTDQCILLAGNEALWLSTALIRRWTSVFRVGVAATSPEPEALRELWIQNWRPCVVLSPRPRGAGDHLSWSPCYVRRYHGSTHYHSWINVCDVDPAMIKRWPSAFLRPARKLAVRVSTTPGKFANIPREVVVEVDGNQPADSWQYGPH